MPKKTKRTPKISLILDLSGLKFQAKADTFDEAVNDLYQQSFGEVKVWGILTLKIGGKKSELQLRPIQIKRAFNPYGKFARGIIEKKLMTALK